MKRIAITAPTGMLGSMVYNVLKDRHKLVLIYRDERKLTDLDAEYGGVKRHKRVFFDLTSLYDDYVAGFEAKGPNMEKLQKRVGPVDGFINCAGITKPRSLKDPLNTVFVNGMLPHVLSRIYEDRLIQITTDCVYDGLSGAPYDEDAAFTYNDLYGFSKRLGEPREWSLVLRTSIIGPEVTGKYLLISWFHQQNGKTVSGYTNHSWNGITTKQFALICDAVISNRTKFPRVGLFHIFSDSVTKYEMLKEFKKKYGINVSIKPTKADRAVDRRLASKFSLVKKLGVPTFASMIADL